MMASVIIRTARLSAGLTQRELARRAHTSQAAIARYERGRSTPTIDTLMRLVGACGLELRMQLHPAPADDQLMDRLEMSVTERLRANESWGRLVAELSGA